MYIRILLSLIFFFAFSASAYAETITVINEDGTKSSIEIGAQPDVPPVKKAAPPRTVTADPAPVTTPAKAPAAKPAKKPAPPKQAATKAPVKKDAAQKSPVKKQTTKKQSAKKQSAPVPKKTAPHKTTQTKSKPAAPAASVEALPARPSAAPVQQRLGPAMTSDDAIRIALDAAPPARSVHAMPVNYKGLHAYQVVFATEEGERSIFVDRESGKIVR